MISRILTCIGLAALLAACEGPLNVDPTDSIPADQLKTAEDIALALNGAYDGLQYAGRGGAYIDGTYTRNLVVFPDMYADNLRFTGTYTSDQQVANKAITASNVAMEDLWGAQYDGINRTNTVLAALAAADGIDAATAASLKGQAEFLRGLFYFNLVRLFGGVPIVLQPTQGVSDASLLPRNSVAEVYQQIEADLGDAAQLLDAGSSPAAATRGAAQALLAKVYLEEGKWAQAQAAADAVIASGDYQLTPAFADVFDNKNSSESIFEVQYSVNDNNNLAFWFFTRPQGGRWGFAPTDDLVAAFDPADPRLAASVAVDGDGRLYGIKYHRIASNDDDVVVLRLADILLSRAEARARQGTGLAAAQADVDSVRARAGLAPLPASLSQPELLDAILHERRLELAFEGQRFFDLRRFGQAQAVLGIDANHLLFPIPQRERDANPNLEQNPGY